MPAYVIGDVRDAWDAEALDEYRRRNTHAVAAHGGRFIVRGGAVEALEGEWDTRRVIVIEFPDMAAARGWYDSEDYAPLKTLRQGATGTVELAWGDVGRAELYGMAGGGRAGMLGIAARRAGAAVWTRGAWLGRVNRRATAYEVSFAARAFADGPEEVISAIERYRGDKKRRRRIGEADEHERLLRE